MNRTEITKRTGGLRPIRDSLLQLRELLENLDELGYLVKSGGAALGFLSVFLCSLRHSPPVLR